MDGINRINEKRNFFQRNSKCVFISHQKKDANLCKKIAEYIKKAGIDVYFDENDVDLNRSKKQLNLKGVVSAIQKGINKSSHMLCVISPNTRISQWVPWEVGYGYVKVQNLSVLTLKGLSDDDLPEYLKVVDIIRGTKSLNEYLSKLVDKHQSRKNLSVLTLKGLSNDDLPEYPKFIRSKKSLSLKEYLSKIFSHKSRVLYFSDEEYSSDEESVQNHPLNDCLDYNL